LGDAHWRSIEYPDRVPPLDHELNLTTQALTDVSWGLTAALLVIAIRMVWAAISLVESASRTL
jgi:hypothetical protein